VIVPLAARVVEHDATVYRHTWRGTMLVSFISPIFFLTAMGIGLGALVNRTSGGVDGVAYLAFLAPGLLVTTAMQTAMAECTYPVLGKVLWARTYEAMLNTPLRVRDLLIGDLSWVAVRMFLVSIAFFVVMAAFGLARNPASILAIPAAALTGMAFATPIFAYSVTQIHDSGFPALQRFVIMPLFLFGGAFFPITRLPVILQWVAQLTPLYHGVVLSRGLTLGRLGPSEAALHAAVLLVYIAIGTVAAGVGLARRMSK
jgi:lipooligosaccharide transport system permease protein